MDVDVVLAEFVDKLCRELQCLQELHQGVFIDQKLRGQLSEDVHDERERNQVEDKRRSSSLAGEFNGKNERQTETEKKKNERKKETCLLDIHFFSRHFFSDKLFVFRHV